MVLLKQVRTMNKSELQEYIGYIDYQADKHNNEKAAGFTVLHAHKQLKKAQLRKRNI